MRHWSDVAAASGQGSAAICPASHGLLTHSSSYVSVYDVHAIFAWEQSILVKGASS